MNRNESWTRSIKDASPFRFVYPEFLTHLQSLELQPKHISGSVLVIGQSAACPEKTLLATPESSFQVLRREVTSVFFCDSDLFTAPHIHFDNPVINTIDFDILPQPRQGEIYFEMSSGYDFLQRAPTNFFDSALMIRVEDTGTQIADYDLIKQLAPHLKPGGFFICSGGRFPTHLKSEFFSPLSPVRVVQLPNYSGGYPFINNMGAILQKM